MGRVADVTSWHLVGNMAEKRLLLCSRYILWIALIHVSYLSNCSSSSVQPPNEKPNIVFFITDDQDLELGGMKPLSKTREWIAENGATFTNSFVTIPICCPSRSSILTGLYQHHTHVPNNTVHGNCWGSEWRDTLEKETYAALLKSKADYTTFHAGKYLNHYGDNDKDLAIPPGWDWWTGLVGNSVYYNYTLSVDGEAEKHGDNYEDDYLTDVIGRKADLFFDNYEILKDKKGKDNMSPFLMVLSVPSAHTPFTPAPQYANEFAELKAPRTPAFNYVENGNEDKHWFMRTPPAPLSDALVDMVDDVFRDRLRTLLSVDDMVDKVMKRLEALELLDNTFVIFTSDHGYHLGTFAMSIDKRLLYETDIRVPLLVRGPGIEPNKVIEDVVVNIDLAPTFLDMAGETHDTPIDGVSFLPALRGNAPHDAHESFIVTYSGEFGTGGIDPGCEGIVDGNMASCWKEWDCKCQDVVNNTYACIRKLNDQEDSIVCQFDDDENFVEAYNIREDPYQLTNINAVKSNKGQLGWIASSLEEMNRIINELNEG